MRELDDIFEHFHKFYLPGYSSYLNSIETCWNSLKRHLNVYFARSERNYQNWNEMEDEVEELMEEWAAMADTEAYFFASR